LPAVSSPLQVLTLEVENAAGGREKNDKNKIKSIDSRTAKSYQIVLKYHSLYFILEDSFAKRKRKTQYVYI